MFRTLATVAATLVSLVSMSSTALAFGPHCEKYADKPLFVQAIKTVAHEMNYTPEELCSLERAGDIYVTHTSLTDERGDLIPHTWLTIHYYEYSCQYFMRDSDRVITKSNCYSGF